jgi:hypothetical protein
LTDVGPARASSQQLETYECATAVRCPRWTVGAC